MASVGLKTWGYSTYTFAGSWSVLMGSEQVDRCHFRNAQAPLQNTCIIDDSSFNKLAWWWWWDSRVTRAPSLCMWDLYFSSWEQIFPTATWQPELRVVGSPSKQPENICSMTEISILTSWIRNLCILQNHISKYCKSCKPIKASKGKNIDISYHDSVANQSCLVPWWNRIKCWKIQFLHYCVLDQCFNQVCLFLNQVINASINNYMKF